VNRKTKLEFYKHSVACPYCRKPVVFTSLMERIIAARRTCPACKREMLIENGTVRQVSREGRTKQPPKRVRSRIGSDASKAKS
jgi:transposase-like protein